MTRENDKARDERMKNQTKKPRPYSDTKVSVLKSRADIDKLLHDHGVTAVQWTTVGERSMLRFQFDHDGQPLMVRMLVDPSTQGDKPGRHLLANAQEAHWAREAKRLHRTLYWAIKSKLEVIDAGLESPLSVWLPAIESGASTFAERVEQQVHQFAQPDYSVGGVLALKASPKTPIAN
jgi:hypothetical protein